MPAQSGPRKVIVGTTVFNMWRESPGLEARLEELCGFIDQMATQAREQHGGARLDIAALPECAVNGGLTGSAEEVALPFGGVVQDTMAAKAREHRCYIVVPMMLAEGEAGPYSNAAVLLDRTGETVGIYRKVYAVPDWEEADKCEGGVTPGTGFPVFDCDFGKVAIQICYDMAFDAGWPVLERKGAELVIWPSQWAGQIGPCSRALRHRFYVLSSTWHQNASLVDPTGHVIREIRGDKGVLVEEIDLEYILLNWQPTLEQGRVFDEAYGSRAGYRYHHDEDSGIFWSDDPSTPIAEMVRALGLETWPDQVIRSLAVQDKARGGPPDFD